MEIKILKNDESIYLMELVGAMDLYGSNQLRELFMKMLENKIEHFIISLKEVDSMNSAGIGALIFVSSTLKKMKCPLVIIAPEGPALQALELTRLKSYFNIVSTLKDALVLAAEGLKKDQ